MTGASHSFDPDPEPRLSLRAILAGNQLLTQVYHRLETNGRWSIPEKGPAILVCNHISGLDPLVIQSVSPRVIVWMMAREYYELRALKWVFKLAEAIPVERSGRDLAATRAAMRALDAGRVLGVFPEGKIETGGDELLPFQTGVALMAIKTGVGVYPAYLDGTSRNREMAGAFLIPNRIRLALGPKVDLRTAATDRESLETATAAIHEAVSELRKSGRENNHK